MAHYINTSDDAHIKLVKSFQKEKEDRNLKSVFKNAERNADELQLSCQFNEEAIGSLVAVDQVAVVSTKRPKSIKDILRQTAQQKRRTEGMELPWLGKYVSQHWKEAETTTVSYQIFKSWKNIPDIVLSVDTSIRQELMNTKVYRKHKLQESVDETNCRLCSNDQETVPHILCGCSRIAQTHTRTGTIEWYDLCTAVYWKRSNSVNLNTFRHGISRAIQYHVWRMKKQKFCGIFHGICKNAQEMAPTNLT